MIACLIYLIFVKAFKFTRTCSRLGRSKIGLKIQIFLSVGPAPRCVGTILHAPWPILIIYITVSLSIKMKIFIHFILVSIDIIISFLEKIKLFAIPREYEESLFLFLTGLEK